MLHCAKMPGMEDTLQQLQYKNFSWLDILSHEKEVIMAVTREHGFDEHFVNDSLQVGHLPKIESSDNCTFMILRGYTCDKDDNCTTVEDLSNKIAVFFTERQIVTIHRYPFEFLRGDRKEFSSVYELLIFLFRKTIASYAEPAQWQSDQIDKLEEYVFLSGRKKISLSTLYYQKQETRLSKKLLAMTKHILIQVEFPKKYNSQVQDIKDRIDYLTLQYEEVLEDASSLTNVYMSITAQKSNDVMKLLTIFSAFFLPITFIAGVYGMNFRNMPELDHRYGYYGALGAMVVVCLVIYQWFKRKKIL